MREQPIQLTYLQALEKRKVLNDQEKKAFYYLNKGYQGELKFDWYYDTYVQEARTTLRNIYLEKGRRTQVDFLAIRGKTLYAFEIKNYEFDLTYDGENWWINNQKQLLDNPIVQVLRMKQVLESIVADFETKIQVIPVLVFINPDYYVDLQKEPTIMTLRSFEVKKFLTQHLQNSHLDRQADKLVNHLKSYTYLEDFTPNQEFEAISLSNLQLGLTCPTCHGFDLEKRAYSITCACGAVHSVRQCLETTIQDYQALFPKKEIRAIDIHTFINQAVSLRTLQKAVKANKDKQVTKQA